MGLLSGRLARDLGNILISERKIYFPARASELSLDVRAVSSHAVAPYIGRTVYRLCIGDVHLHRMWPG